MMARSGAAEPGDGTDTITIGVDLTCHIADEAESQPRSATTDGRLPSRSKYQKCQEQDDL